MDIQTQNYRSSHAEERGRVQRIVSGREMMADYLKEHGYDGLYCNECGCEIADLMPCGGEWAIDCVAGYKHDGCTEYRGNGCDFHIGPKRR
jgi:hypothetical protein